MPNPAIYFPAKVVIYSLAGWALNQLYKKGPNPFIFGLLRVGIGFGLGIVLLFVFTALSAGSSTNSVADYAWLVLTRLFVWAAMIWFFYEGRIAASHRFFIVLILGTLLSFGIDAGFHWIDKEFSGLFSIPMC